MRDAHGHETIFEPGGEVYEYDTFKCNHCGGHRRTLPGQAMNICKGCMSPICDWCYGQLRVRGCRTEEEYLDRMERAIERRLQNDRALEGYRR